MAHKQTALDALTYIRQALDGLAHEYASSHAVLTLAQVQATVRCAQQEVEAIQELRRPRRVVPTFRATPVDEGGEA